jgi:PST family polysaccharide transporter
VTSARARRTSLGALALTGASALRLTLQFALLPILARLIGPAGYGLVALAMPFILFANVLADGGMSYALGRRKDVSAELESTVFWLAGAMGAALAFLCCAAAWPMGAILHQPRLPPLIMALSPIMLMNGLTAASNGRIIREGRFGTFAIGDLISTVVSASVAVLAALKGLGAWSLVAQQLTLWLCKLTWVTFAGKARIGPTFRLQEAVELLRFGMHTIGATLADFVSRNVDALIVGGVLGVTSLGYYAMAYQIVRVPDMLISGPLYLYIFTAVSRTAHDAGPRALQDLATSALRLGSTALAPLFCGLALTADLAVPLVLGEKWIAAIAPLRWLAAAGFFFCICSIVGTTLMGLGRTALQLRLSLVLGATTIVVVAAAARLGLVPVSAALAVGMGGACALYIHRLAHALELGLVRLALSFAPALTGCAAMVAAVTAFRSALTAVSPEPVVEFALLVAVGAAVYGAVLWTIARRRLREDLYAFGRAQSERPADPASVPETLASVA